MTYFACQGPTAINNVFTTVIFCYFFWNVLVVSCVVKKLEAAKKVEPEKHFTCISPPRVEMEKILVI
jgi:hypothetical protein